MTYRELHGHLFTDGAGYCPDVLAVAAKAVAIKAFGAFDAKGDDLPDDEVPEQNRRQTFQVFVVGGMVAAA